jgi:hypothetical protein
VAAAGGLGERGRGRGRRRGRGRGRVLLRWLTVNEGVCLRPALNPKPETLLYMRVCLQPSLQPASAACSRGGS